MVQFKEKLPWEGFVFVVVVVFSVFFPPLNSLELDLEEHRVNDCKNKPRYLDGPPPAKV